MSHPTRRFNLALGLSLILGLLAVRLLSLHSGHVHAQGCVQPPSGIIAWWPLDETSGTTARDLVGNRPGVHVNGPVPTDGKVGGALRFDGVNDYVGVGDSDAWAFGRNDFTIELWANFAVPGGGSIGHPGHVFISHNEGSGMQNKWFFALGGGFLYFHINSPTIGAKFFPLVPFSPAVGQWYHLAVTRKVNTYTIVVNGTAGVSADNSDAIPNANAPLVIGQSNEPFGGFMNGRLDEITIYNRALAQAELQAIANAGGVGKCKALSITTPSVPTMQIGAFSSFTFTTQFGVPPFSWSIVSGAIPSGMNLSPAGVLNGTPIEAGAFTFTLKVSDSNNQVSEKTFTLDILLTLPPPILRIRKTGTVAVPGRTFDQFIIIENRGNVTASNLQIVDMLHSSFNLLSTNPPAVTNRDSSILIWNIDSLASGESKLLTSQVRINPATPLGKNVGRPVCTAAELVGIAECIRLMPLPVGCDTLCGTVCGTIPDACFISFNPIICGAAIGGCIGCIFDCSINSGERIETCFEHFNCDLPSKVTSGPVDPNEKLVVAKRFIQPDQLLIYPIHFENIGNAEARDIFVTDVLDPNLDVSTLKLLTPNGGTFDSATRTIMWNLLSRNLPPGATDNILLSVRPRSGIPSGTEIRNSAKIKFEVFNPIITNEVVNIIDSIKPSSTVNPLQPTTSALEFPILWSGTDAVGEIDFYTIFVSVDGRAFTPFLEKTRDTSAMFRGEPGRTYGFLSIATDTAGNTEVQPAVAEATTRVTVLPVRSVSAASFIESPLASESIVAAFGTNLATATQQAGTIPLPTQLAGTTIKVRDSAGSERLGPLFFVSPTQVNYLLPAGITNGVATVTITNQNGVVSAEAIQIATVAPGLFGRVLEMMMG